MRIFRISGAKVVGSRPAFTLTLSGLALLALLLCQSSTAFASKIKKDQPHSCSDFDADFSPETNVHALDEYQEAIAQLLKDQKFSELDCIADSARISKARFSGAAWKLRNVYLGLNQPRPGHPTEEDWRKHLQLVDRWTKKNSQSTTARIALAESYINYAWDARGNGTADSVSENGWKLLGERLEKAKTILSRDSMLSQKCPEWYVAMEQVAQGQNWKLGEQNALFERAADFEPDYQYVYRLHATILLPRWRGAEGDAAYFAQSIADHIGGDAGDTLYFHVAFTIACCADDAEFKHFSWPRVQKGFAHLEEKYGPSLETTNGFALMAVKVRDYVAADAAFQRIGNQWDKDVWRTETWFSANKFRAAHIAPSEMRSRADKSQARNNMQTIEGSAYGKSVAEKLAVLEKSCGQNADRDQNKIEFWIQVAADGNIRDIRSNPTNSMAECLTQKLFAPHHTENAPFPPPPHAPYWVIFDLDAGVLSTAAK
jgi:hypothetical protein